MLNFKFQISEPRGPEEEDFIKYFSIYLYSSNLGLPCAGPS